MVYHRRYRSVFFFFWAPRLMLQFSIGWVLCQAGRICRNMSGQLVRVSLCRSWTSLPGCHQAWGINWQSCCHTSSSEKRTGSLGSSGRRAQTLTDSAVKSWVSKWVKNEFKLVAKNSVSIDVDRLNLDSYPVRVLTIWKACLLFCPSIHYP